MDLNITYDANTLKSAPSAFFSAVNDVVSLFDATFTNSVTVNIEIGYGTFPFDNSAVPALSESRQNGVVSANYAQIKQALINEGAPGATILPALAPLTGNLETGSAQEKALGLINPSGTLDGWVGVASDTTLSRQLGASWSYSPTAIPGNSQYYLVGALEHEIAEVMGRVSYLDAPGEYGVMDLYRYGAPGARQTGTGSPAYFSIDHGNTNLDNWNTASGGDFGDWASSTGADAFLAFSPSGQINGLTATDITLMQALGYSVPTGPTSPTNPSPAVSSSPAFDLSWNLLGVGDFNGDGKADLGWERSSDNLVELQLFNGSTPNGGGVIGNSPFDASWRAIATADVNGDGKADLVYRRLSDGFTEIQLLNGTQGIGGGAISNNPFDGSWQIVAASDFNGDGNADLAWRHSGDGLLEVQFLNGITAKGGGVVANNPFDASWNIVATGDFNADGKDDLVWRRSSDGLVEIQFLNGNSATGGGTIVNNSFDSSWNVGAAGDFLGNGHSDLVWQRPSDGLVEIQYLNGNAAVGGGIIQGNPFGAGWQVVGAADFNGDGKSDLVYRRASDGVTEVQLLNGTTIIGGGAPPSSDMPDAGLPNLGISTSGSETIGGGAGQISGDTAAPGHDTVTGFDQALGDRLFLPNDTAAGFDQVVATAQISGGNAIISLPNGSDFTLVGVTHIDHLFFS